MNECLNCGRDSQQVPLIRLEYKEGEYLICPTCLPTLIHKPQNLEGKLPQADSMEPGPTD
ncbi:MAG TPA: hypothetical protein VN226_05565 [Anaerolineales bacterium]|nr:hypothetical protein [Anaerolineales bacterium]